MELGFSNLLLIVILASIVDGLPNYQRRIPNGDRVSCIEASIGCVVGHASRSQPAHVCGGLGHNTCAGGHHGWKPDLGPFGVDFEDADTDWQKVCNKDSDGDGLTNGEELGDPCCTWTPGQAPTSYMQGFAPTHPGRKDHFNASFKKPPCASLVQLPEEHQQTMNAFRDGEVRRHVDFVIQGYEVPVGDTYADFAFNFDDESMGKFHIVFGEMILDQPKLLHHVTIFGCARKFSDTEVGKVIQNRSKIGDCRWAFGGWNPGATPLPAPTFAGTPIGRNAGIVAVRLNVHYANRRGSMSVVSRDGLRLHYTSTLRNQELDFFGVSVLSLESDARLQLPAEKERFFITRTCKLQGPVDARANIVFSVFHAHMLGREMYSTVKFANGSQVDLGSMPQWRFDSQEVVNLLHLGLQLRPGDELQGTCVFNSTGRKGPTAIGESAVDEMCYVYLTTWPAGSRLRCEGPLWMGELAVGESAFVVAERHSVETAEEAWSGPSSPWEFGGGAGTVLVPKDAWTWLQGSGHKRRRLR